MISAHDCCVQTITANITATDNSSDCISIGTSPFWTTNISGNPVIQVFCRNRQHCFGGIGSVNSCDDLQQITISERMQQLIAIMMQGKRDPRMSERHAVHGI
ncbi:hypothetical protein D3C75_451130 [compost metagenome]